MEEWADSMMISGYQENYRKKAIQCVVVGYEKMLDKSRKDLRPLYRPREWQAGERRKKKHISKTAWFRPQDTVMFVPVTLNGELAKRVRKVVEDEEWLKQTWLETNRPDNKAASNSYAVLGKEIEIHPTAQKWRPV